MNKEGKKVMLLSEALRERIVTEESFIDYVPDYQEITLGRELTGWDKEQTFSTAMKLGYNPFIVEKEKEGVEAGIYLVADDTMETELTLQGEIGYNNGPMAIKRCSKLQSSKKFSGEGIELTSELWKLMPDALKYKVLNFWIASRYSLSGSGLSIFGLQSVASSGVNGYLLYASHGVSWYGTYGVRPVVHLPSNIMVVINDPERDGTSKEKAFELVPNVDGNKQYTITRRQLDDLKAKAEEMLTKAQDLIKFIEEIER